MNEKLKQKLLSNEAIVVYLIVLLSAVIGFANPTFLSPATGINLLRTMLVTLLNVFLYPCKCVHVGLIYDYIIVTPFGTGRMPIGPIARVW